MMGNQLNYMRKRRAVDVAAIFKKLFSCASGPAYLLISCNGLARELLLTGTLIAVAPPWRRLSCIVLLLALQVIRECGDEFRDRTCADNGKLSQSCFPVFKKCAWILLTQQSCLVHQRPQVARLATHCPCTSQQSMELRDTRRSH
jgi:hypothetical protein